MTRRSRPALTSDFTDADLPGLGSNVDALGKQLSGNGTGGSVDVNQIADTATSLSKTLSPLVDLLQSGAANTAATAGLAGSPSGHTGKRGRTSPHHSQPCGPGRLALDLVATIANTAAKLANNGATTLPATAPEISQLAGTAASLGDQIAPVAATRADALSSASSVLSVLKPKVVVDQALNVVTGVTALDIPAILHNLIVLPQKIAAGDVRAARDTARELNVQFEPIVTMVAGVDLKWISQILAIIPDPSGYTQIAALVTSILGNVDVIKLANIAVEAQEIAWAAADKLFPPPGVLPDPVGAAAQTTALIPLGLDLASVAANMLTGKASKTDPALLGKQTNPVGNAITTPAAAERFADLDLAGQSAAPRPLLQRAPCPGHGTDRRPRRSRRPGVRPATVEPGRPTRRLRPPGRHGAPGQLDALRPSRTRWRPTPTAAAASRPAAASWSATRSTRILEVA